MKMEKEEIYKIANSIKAQIDLLIDEYGFDAEKSLSDVNDMPRWLVLKNKAPETILLAMDFYLEGVLRTLRRLKPK